MMAQYYDELKALLEDIQKQLGMLLSDVRIPGNQIVVHEGLSDISEKLGLLRAGEFRVGNSVEPGSGYTGVRIAYPAMSYLSVDWNVVGVLADVLQFGLRAADGKALFGAGEVILDAAGMTVGSSAPQIIIDAANKMIKSSNYSAGTEGFALFGADGSAEFEDVIVRGEIRSAVFSKSEIASTAGTIGVFKSAGKSAADTTTVDSPTTFNIDIQDPATGHVQLFAVNDILRLKDGTNDVWATVSSVSDQTTFYRYVCTRNYGTNATFKAGTGIIDYGVSGDGFLLLTADDSNAPFYSIRTHAGAPWTIITEVVRLGNLNGFLTYTTDTYGIAIGDSTNYLTYDPIFGMILRGSIIIAADNPFGLNVWSETPIGSINGTNTTFLLSQNAIDDTTMITLNGMYLYESDDYTQGAVSTIELVIAPEIDDLLYVSYLRSSDHSRVLQETPTGLINGVNTTFTVTNAFVAGSITVELNGILLDNVDDFYEGGTVITLTVAPEIGDDITAGYQTISDSSWVYQEVPTGAINGVNTVFTTAYSFN
jgi:hypothetical protein